MHIYCVVHLDKSVSVTWLILTSHISRKCSNSFLDASSEFLSIFHDFNFFALFGGIGRVFFQRDFGTINFGGHPTQTDKYFLVFFSRIVGLIDRKHQGFFLFSKSQELLDLIKLVLVFALVQKDLTIGIID